MNGCLSDRNFIELGVEGLSETVQISVSLGRAIRLLRCCSRPSKLRYHPHRCYKCNRKWNQVTDLSVKEATLNQNDICYYEVVIISARACIHKCSPPHSFQEEGLSFGFDPLNQTACCEQLKMAVLDYHSLRRLQSQSVSKLQAISFSVKLRLWQRVCRTCSFINFRGPSMWSVFKLMHLGS